MTVYDGKIGFVDQQAKKIVAVWAPEYRLSQEDEKEEQSMKKEWAHGVEEEIKKYKPYTVEILASVTIPAKTADGAKKQAMLFLGGRDGVNWTQVQSVKEGGRNEP